MIRRIHPNWLLLAGLITVPSAHMTISVDLAGWIAYTPFLIFLFRTNGLRSRLLFFLTLVASWSLTILKILSSPMPLAMVFLFSVPIALFHLPGFLIWDRFKKRRLALLLFPAIMTLMEWVQYTFTPFASWGVAAYTQSHSIPMIQSLSVFGMPGLSFIIYWIHSGIAHLLIDGKPSRITTWIPLSAIIILLVYGALRYDIAQSEGADTIKVAGISTESRVGGWPLPSVKENILVKESLFSRTVKAAESGAKLVVWNEGSTFTLPEDEETWIASLSTLAKENRITLVVSYIVPLPEKIYQNKLLIFEETGQLLYTYNKHEPVPGEPAIKGTEPINVVKLDQSNLAGAICYDYDFPYLAAKAAKAGADIVALPSSDWRGIDPIHSRMAAYRAVEQGFSILRSTRLGLSAAITPYGDFTAKMSYFDNNDRIMIAHLPRRRVSTLYSILGDWVVYLSILFISGFFLAPLVGKRKLPEGYDHDKK